ncbi:UNVERIFIED_CONTAM: hypothetical protein PYX00_009754 [Menopon gallinae]|uniref:KIF-binding protein n=1 Tax=Menopon gallinae TaxID=328185 RepID=A0AAW2HCI6_9NEOP
MRMILRRGRMESELWKKYQNVASLLEEESLKDPKEEPYRSRYKAKNILLEMESMVTKNLENLDPSHADHTTNTAMLAAILMQIGIISIETEEPSEGEEYLMKAFEMITDHLDRRFVINSMHIRNHLGILWSQRSESSKAQTWLEGSEKLYEDYKKRSPTESPLTPQELFEVNGEEEKNHGSREIERVHTLTKFYLAQVYGSLKDLLRSAIYCHETLRRQLVCGEYDSIDWALNSATLSQFFMERILFTQARHHLAAASYILEKYENSLKDMTGTEEEIEGKKEELRHRSADVSRCWAKYGIFLLEYSTNKLCSPQSEKEKETEDGDLKDLWFTSLDLSKYENEVLACELVMYEDARQTFLFTQRHLNKAKEYYSLECHASDHVQVVQDHSQLFKHLTAFENDEDKQCKMIKRRIDLLQDVLKELNPKYYLHACRQLWFELGESYHDIMHIKFQRVKGSKEVPTPHALKKINFLIEQSIANFTHFLDSVKENSTKELPEVLDEEMIKPTLIAHFYLGRLYYKIITQDVNKQAENMNKSYTCFQYLVDYCNKSDYAKELLSEELNVSKEMMSLLQIKSLQI